MWPTWCSMARTASCWVRKHAICYLISLNVLICGFTCRCAACPPLS